MRLSKHFGQPPRRRAAAALSIKFSLIQKSHFLTKTLNGLMSFDKPGLHHTLGLNCKKFLRPFEVDPSQRAIPFPLQKDNEATHLLIKLDVAIEPRS